MEEVRKYDAGRIHHCLFSERLLQISGKIREMIHWKQIPTLVQRRNHMGTIYLAGGCFWGLQKFFDQFSGVIRTEVGYANGPDKAPSYQEVCRNSFSIGPVYITLTRDSFRLSEKSMKDSRQRWESLSQLLSSRSGISSQLRSITRNIWIRIPAGTAIFRDHTFPWQTNKKLVSQKM